MEEFYGGFNGSRRDTRRVTMEDEDLEEEDVWATMMTAKESSSNSNSKTKKNSSSSSSSSSSSYGWSLNTTPRAIPKANSGYSATQQSSAPVEVPDWSKILKKKSTKKLWDDDACNGDGHDDDDMVPPHEYLAKRLASSQISSFSMCEGVGRTLKGRDLSRLRNAILTKTGFLE